MNLLPIQYFKYPLFLVLLVSSLFLSCKEEIEDEGVPETDFGYQIEIDSPSDESIFSIGDSLPIQVRFISETDEIVHNIKLEIYNSETPGNNIYSVESHVHVQGQLDYSDVIILNEDEVTLNDNSWVCVASVWSHELNAEVTSDTSYFQIVD